MGLIKACDMSDLEDGEIFKAEIEGEGALAIYLVDEEVFATADICTHGEASLSDDGYIEDGDVICSWHDGAFDSSATQGREGEAKKGKKASAPTVGSGGGGRCDYNDS